MKNSLFYYYHLYPENLLYHNKEYQFQIGAITYRLLTVVKPEAEIKELVLLNQQMVNYKEGTPRIVLNEFKEAITFINKRPYILLAYLTNNQVSYQTEILKRDTYPFALTNYPLLNRSDWLQLWTHKIDYFEYQKGHIKYKYPFLYKSLDYYIGLSENAISYITMVSMYSKKEQVPLTICHRRCRSTMSFFDYTSPLNLVIDYAPRDTAEYLKSLFIEDHYQEDELLRIVSNLHYSDYEYGLLMGRLLFPTFYFDLYEKIINDIISEKEIIPVLEKSNDYEYFLQFLYQSFIKHKNIPRIDWLETKKEP